jgi:hypothetical protein
MDIEDCCGTAAGYGSQELLHELLDGGINLHRQDLEELARRLDFCLTLGCHFHSDCEELLRSIEDWLYYLDNEESENDDDRP